MPDTKPKFNPNQPYSVAETASQKPSFNPNKPFKEVGAIEKDPFTIVQEEQDRLGKTQEIIDNIPDMDDGRKKSLKDLVTRGVIKGNQISDVILTYQGKHPKQSGGDSSKFYTDEKGIPHPLANDERPPKEYQINSIWGEQTDAEDDSPLTTLGKNIYNILPSIAENAIDLVHMPYGASTGQEADWYKSLKNSANYLKAKTSSSSQAPVINTEGIDEFSDIFEGDRWNFTADNVAGTVGQIVKSVGEFAVGGGFVSKAVGATSKLGKGASLFTASYATQLGETIDRAKEAGLTTEDAYRVGSAINVPIAMVDLALGVEGRLFKDELAKTGRKELVDNLVKGFVKDSEGKITKEGLDELFKSTLIANSALVKNWGKQTMGDVVGEGSQEAIQAFVQNAGEQLYDKMSDEEKAKFGTDAFSPKAFADYLQNFVVGAIGGAPSGVAVNKIKQITKDNEQSKTAFGLVQPKDGESQEDLMTRINSYKANILNEVEQGKLTKEQADNAIFRIDSYRNYNEKVQGLNIDETKKRQLFDLSFKKEELVGELVGEMKGKSLDDMNPIDQAKYKTKEKLAQDMQKQINEIVMKAQLKEETTVADKTIEDVAKKENPPKKEGEKKIKLNPIAQAIADKYKKDKEVSKKEYPEETRSYEQIPMLEFNNPTKISGGFRTIHKKAVEFLETQPEKKILGKIVHKPFEYGGKKNKTYGVQMPDGKILRFSSSMQRDEGFRGHMRTEHLVKEDELEGFPIGLKVEEIPAFEEGKAPKKVIKAFNANTGKFVGYMKETNTGKKTDEYNTKQKDYLEHLGTVIEPPIIPPTSGEIKPVPTQPTPVLNVQQPTKEEYVSQKIEALKADETADYDPYLEESGLYEKAFTDQYEKEYGKDTAGETQLDTRADIESGKKGDTTRKGKKGTPKARRKIKHPLYKKALQIEPNTAHELVLQYFIGGGKINPSAIEELYRRSGKEKQARLSYLNKHAPTIEGVAHYIWSNQDFQRWDDVAIKDEVENVVNGYVHPTAMAKALVEAHNEKLNPQEMAVAQVMDEAEKNEVLPEVESLLDEAENVSDIELLEDEDIFEKLWGKAKLPEIKRPDIKEGEEPFQKEASKKEAVEKIVDTLRKVLNKDIKIEYDSKLKAAGKWNPKTKTITINPKLAGKDTPIHEVGHILIDVMGGTNNRVIRKAIEQLKGTPLWKETEGRYPLSENYTIDDLGMEVLAEAIGREGKDIFETETEKSRFKTYLDYIFNWLKRNLGLEKNIAKNLAKQVISGINIKPAEVGGKESFQKNKIEELQSDLEAIEEQLDIEEDEDNITELERVRDAILEKIETLNQEAEDFKKGIVKVKKVADADSLEGFTLDQLIEVYNDARNYDGYADKEMLDKAKMRIAYFLNQEGKERLESKFGKEITESANKKDLKWNEIWFKTLGHISQDFPELQEFYKIFNTAFLDMQTERNEKKSELQKLGKAVIYEYNKKMGIAGRALDLFSSNNAKYFNYLEDNGKFRTSTAGLSKAQIDLLNFMKRLVKDRAESDVENEILKIDKGFIENWKDESLMTAIANYMGGGNNGDVEIQFGGKPTKFKDAQKAILNDSKKGVGAKALALPKLLQIAYKAKKGSEKSNYGLNYNGQLTSKFDQPRDKDKGYSKDFYNAAMQFIDDQSHIKHMGKLVPLVDSIEQFYKYLGFEQGQSFGNILKFIEQWKSTQIYQRKGETDPIIDKTLQFFRRLTSQIVMGFNLPAAAMNVFIGTYNNWRSESAPLILKGNKRLFGKDGLNKFGIDVLNKFNVVSQDFDSNPKAFAGKLFDMMAFGATRFGEYQIQGSMFLGQLTDKEWDSFEYKDGKMVLKKGVDEKAFKNKMNQYKDRVSDIQGKYNTKDQINFSRFEAGKSALQFRLWLPSYLKERFGKRYIDANNVEHVGSWRTLAEQSFADLRKQMKTKEWWTSKETMANLKGLMAVTSLAILANLGDDDDKKRRSALSAENALGQMLFLLDPSQAKYMIKSPVASFGTIEKFITASEDLLNNDMDKFEKDVMKVIPYTKAVTPVKNLINNDKK